MPIRSGRVEVTLVVFPLRLKSLYLAAICYPPTFTRANAILKERERSSDLA